MHEISHMHLEVNTVSFFLDRWQKRPQQTGNCVLKGRMENVDFPWIRLGIECLSGRHFIFQLMSIPGIQCDIILVSFSFSFVFKTSI